MGGQLLQALATIRGAFQGLLQSLKASKPRAICCLLSFPRGIFFTSRSMRAMVFLNISLLKMLVTSFCVAGSRSRAAPA